MHVIHLSYFNFNKLKLIFLSFHLKFLILDVYFIVFQLHLFLTLKLKKKTFKMIRKVVQNYLCNIVL